MSDTDRTPVILHPPAVAVDAEWDLDGLYPDRQPLEVDVGCGKGRFLLARAQKYPTTNFLGVDRMRKRLEKVEKKVCRAQVRNVRLIQMEAAYLFERLLPANRIAACYIFFPDPWPKRRHHRRRLFSEAFMDALHRCLIPGGQAHIATDHLPYFTAIHGVLSNDSRFVEIAPFIPDAEEQTHFELIFLGQKKDIGRCSFMTTDDGAPPPRRRPE